MLRTRILAALLFTPALVAVLCRGGLALQLSALGLSMLLLGEYVQLTLRPGASALRATTYALGLVHALSTLGLWSPPVQGSFALLLGPLSVAAVLLATLAHPEPLSTSITQAALSLLGVGWCTTLLPALGPLRAQPNVGLSLALMAVLCTWGADTGAYFAGRAFGRRRLAPKISPAKTLEGAGGGLVAGGISGLALAAVCGGPSPRWALCIGAACALAGVLGDLSESLLKRSVGQKDSSALIPGHGGVFDRFDGVLFAVPVVQALAPYVA